MPKQSDLEKTRDDLLEALALRMWTVEKDIGEHLEASAALYETICAFKEARKAEEERPETAKWDEGSKCWYPTQPCPQNEDGSGMTCADCRANRD